MRGNSPVGFLGEGATVTLLPYPTGEMEAGMSLDWHMQGVDGRPDATVPWVPMDEDAHADLFAQAGLNIPHHGQGRYPGNRHRRASAARSPAPARRPLLPPLPLLARAADYYEDAAYAPTEVPELLAELAAVGPRAGAAAEVVSALVALCEEAARRRQGIVVLAD